MASGESVLAVIMWQPLWIVIFCVGFVWSIGFCGLGFWWSLWCVPLFFAWLKLQHDRVLRRSIFEYEKLTKRNRGVHTESAEWVNRCTKNFWVTTREYVIGQMIDQSAQLFEQNKPSFVHKVTLENVKLGDNYPSISEVFVHEIASDQFHFDADLSYYSDMNMELVTQIGFARFPVLVRDFFIKGKVRVHVWLLAHPPFVSHVQISFVGQPEIDMIVKLIKLGPDIMSVPGLSASIKKMMFDIIEQIVVYPNFYEYILSPEFVQRPGDEELLRQRNLYESVTQVNQGEQVNPEGTGATALEAGMRAPQEHDHTHNLAYGVMRSEHGVRVFGTEKTEDELRAAAGEHVSDNLFSEAMHRLKDNIFHRRRAKSVDDGQTVARQRVRDGQSLPPARPNQEAPPPVTAPGSQALAPVDPAVRLRKATSEQHPQRKLRVHKEEF